ncbi:MAG: 1-deoxy-D-xylulose-5-phosphate synthase N-terminal domain-containing protein, partial [Planctomycetota bacterium]
MSPLLEKINGPADLDALSVGELAHLAEEMREFITHSVSQTGGHLASNLGVVEMTIALHRAFD